MSSATTKPATASMLPTLETPTLTKAELAELLFERLGLNKRESKDMVEAFFEIIHGTPGARARTSSCRASATSTSGARRRGPGATRAPAKRSRSRPATWSHFTPVTSSRASCKATYRREKSSSKVLAFPLDLLISMEKALPAIPAKRYFTIGEVSELCGVKPYVLRYWEQEFTQLKPMKRRGNRRYYQHHEVLLIRRIRDLLYEQGFTISGARNRLSDEPCRARRRAANGVDGEPARLDAARRGRAESQPRPRAERAAACPRTRVTPAQLRRELLSIRELLALSASAGARRYNPRFVGA